MSTYEIISFKSSIELQDFKIWSNYGWDYDLNEFQYLRYDLWSIMMFLWDFTFMATIANIWELWCLIDFYWDYDDANERVWYVKVYFSP